MLAHVLHRAVRQVQGAAARLFFGGHFLPVQGNHHRVWRGAGRLNQRNRLAHGRASAHHIVHDQHPALERGTHQRSALAVVFGLFAVVGKGHVVA